MRTRRVLLTTLLLTVAPVLLPAMDRGSADGGDEKTLFTLSKPKTYELNVTVRIGAGPQALRRVTVMVPVPMDWREQQVEMLSEETPRGVTTRDLTLEKHATVMSVSIPSMPARSVAVVERVYRVTRQEITFPEDLSTMQAPRRVPAELRQYLVPSPGIEMSDRRIRQLAANLKDAAGDVATARACFNWVRENVKYKLDTYRGAKFAMTQKSGDCEDMAALFIALCRISGIPARLVWVEGHAYAEFYLEAADGTGHWLPAQLVGPEWFGRMTEYRVILQKGDRIRNPLTRKYEHYAPQTLTALGGTATLAIDRSVVAPGNKRD